MRTSLALSLVVASAVVGCGSSSHAPPAAASDSGTVVDDAPELTFDADHVDIAPPPDPNARAFDDVKLFMEEELARNGVPGGAIAVVLDGKLAFSGGVGVKKAGESDPITADSLFRVGSITKMVLAETVLTYVEEGKLDLKKPVTDYVPWFTRGSGSDASKVTIWNLLTHTSGIPDDLQMHCPVTIGTIKQAFVGDPSAPLWSPSGRLYNYSNMGYSLAAAILEETQKQPFGELMEARVMKPAGMATATWDPKVALAADHAVGHNIDPTTHKPVKFYEPTSYDCAMLRAPGGIFASVIDYAHYAEHLLAGGKGVVKPETIAAMQGKQFDMHEFGESYGYGFITWDRDGLQVVAHDGLVWGYTTVVYTIPSKNFAVVLFLNSDWIYAPWPVAERAVEKFLGVPRPKAKVWTTPESEWGKYLGEFDASSSSLGLMDVTANSAGFLRMSMPAIGGGDLAMRQDGGDAWSVVLPAPNGPLNGTFWFDDAGKVEYFATRAGVGRYTGPPPTPASPTMKPSTADLPVFKAETRPRVGITAPFFP